MSLYIAKTWKNAIKAVTLVPLRVLILLPLICLAKLGEWAESVGNFVCLWIPGFDFDHEREQLERKRRMSDAVKRYHKAKHQANERDE